MLELDDRIAMKNKLSYSRMRPESGVALITILLVVVIATVLGVTIVKDQNTTLLRARSFFDQSQAKQYALGGEELARQILWEDFDSGEKKDHLGEAWASQELQFEFEDGDVRILIEDMQSRLNVNSLVGAQAPQARERFLDLLNQIGLDVVFADRIADWIDEDGTARQLGAEDYQYLGLDQAYRTGGQLMLDVSELRLLLEMDWESFQKLLPYVTAIPDTESVLNINTADAIVLQTISKQLDPSSAEQLLTSREEAAGFDTITEFLQLPELAGMGISEEGLGVQSVFFKVKIIARFQERFSYLTSIVQRDSIDGSTRVIYRNNSNKILPIVRAKTENGQVDDV